MKGNEKRKKYGELEVDELAADSVLEVASVTRHICVLGRF